MKRFFAVLAEMLEPFVGFLLGAITLVVFLQVIFRYVLGIIAPWTEELARYISIWMVYAGALVAAIRSDHIRVAVVADSVKGKLRIALDVFSNLIGVAVCFVIVSGSVRLIFQNSSQMAVTLPVPVSILYIPLLVFGIIGSIVLVFQSIERLRGGSQWN